MNPNSPTKKNKNTLRFYPPPADLAVNGGGMFLVVVIIELQAYSNSTPRYSRSERCTSVMD